MNIIKIILKWLRRFNDWMNDIPDELKKAKYYNIWL
jgi:hypothetical protein